MQDLHTDCELPPEQDEAGDLEGPPPPGPLPRAAFLSPWQAAQWRAFGSIEPFGALHRRSFDKGAVKRPDETAEAHAQRVEWHRRFDGAEQEVRELLALGRLSATGRKPARTAANRPMRQPGPKHEAIPAEVFRNKDLAFGQSGELNARIDFVGALVPPLDVRDTDADPGIPLYYDIQIPTAELLAVWQPEASAPDEGPGLKTIQTDPRSSAGTVFHSGISVGAHGVGGWLPAAAAVDRIAFGPNGPGIRWGHDWGIPPDPIHVAALAACAAGQTWRPTEALPRPASYYRANVRKLMREQHRNSASELLEHARAVADADTKRRAALNQAEEALTAAVRDGTLPAIGVRVATPNGEAPFGQHEPVALEVLANPDRVIRLFGDLDRKAEQPGDLTSIDGPFYADIRVDADRLRDLWPPMPLEPAKLRLFTGNQPTSMSHLSLWEAVQWRAFGSFYPRDFGPPEDRRKPVRWQQLRQVPLAFETSEDHALRMGLIVARNLAERELKELLMLGRVVAYGRPAAKDAAGRPLNLSGGMHEAISAAVFLRNDLWFSIEGTVEPDRTPEVLNRYQKECWTLTTYQFDPRWLTVRLVA